MKWLKLRITGRDTSIEFLVIHIGEYLPWKCHIPRMKYKTAKILVCDK